MAKWIAFPYRGEYDFDVASVKKNWSRLHACDQEPLPGNQDVLQAWALFHSGDFQKATQLGLKLGAAGLNVANKSICVYASYLEPQEERRQDMFQEVAERCTQQLEQDPNNINARYLRAYALSRFSQGISVAKALAQGLGNKIKTDLEQVIAREPRHVDAYITLGSFHAEVIDKVGSLIGAMAYGASKNTGLGLFNQALRLNVASAFGMLEYAHAMLMLDGEKLLTEANRLYQLAACAEPIDAMERLDVEMAKSELSD